MEEDVEDTNAITLCALECTLASSTIALPPYLFVGVSQGVSTDLQTLK